MNIVAEAFLFFLPAGVANATPVLANKIPLIRSWRTPVDFGKSWRSKRLLGNNKTWRGILTGTLLAGLTGLLIYQFWQLQTSWPAAFGLSLLMGLGALLGDAVESGIKRRLGIAAGHSWFPWDQIDYIIGGLALVYAFSDLTLRRVGLIFAIFFVLHLLTAYLAYLAGLKERPI
ncbi:MAG: CDP-archaeol synthase [Candidatus Saccharimonadales bacterium]